MSAFCGGLVNYEPGAQKRSHELDPNAELSK
jgi:hypothetical protein